MPEQHDHERQSWICSGLNKFTYMNQWKVQNEYALKLGKPFQVEYDTATESVKIIDPVNHVSVLLEELRGNIQKVQDYVRHHMVKS
ncbi:hypothetical protein AAHC03_022657 [Spirometra sp. Aus1]